MDARKKRRCFIFSEPRAASCVEITWYDVTLTLVNLGDVLGFKSEYSK